jgi:hypothetical protein
VNEHSPSKQPTRGRLIKRAALSLVASISIYSLLVFGSIFLPPSWAITDFLGAALIYCYRPLCWSQPFFDPIFPSHGSAPSSECYIAMLVTDALLTAALFFILLTIGARVCKARNA